jgi:hypothetical protein
LERELGLLAYCLERASEPNGSRGPLIRILISFVDDLVGSDGSPNWCEASSGGYG